jgi:hypothetical protein
MAILATATPTIHLAPSTDHTTAWIAVGGAILVALIAAGTAQWRLHAQLAHDRGMADIADMRKLLEEALLLTDKTHRTLALMESQRRLRAVWRPMETEISEIDQANRESATLLNALNIRLGDSDPLYGNWRTMHDALMNQWRAIERNDGQAYIGAEQTYDLAHVQLVKEARKRVGSKID